MARESRITNVHSDALSGAADSQSTPTVLLFVTFLAAAAAASRMVGIIVVVVSALVEVIDHTFRD